MVVSCSILVTDVNSTEALKHLNRRLDQTDESESGLGEQRNIRSRQQLEYKRSGVWHARMHSKSAQSDLTFRRYTRSNPVAEGKVRWAGGVSY